MRINFPPKITSSLLSFLQLLLLMIATASCVSTRQTALIGECVIDLKAGDKILVSQISGISMYQSSKLYEKLAKRMQKASLEPFYALEQEMDLKLHQIIPLPDSSNLKALQKMGYTYYLTLHTSSKEATDLYQHTSSQEKREQREAAARLESAPFDKEEDVTKAQLTFSLYLTDEKRKVYSLVTQTEMHPLPLPGKNDETTEVNLSKTSMALDKALQKGLGKLLKSCGCDK